MIVCFPVFGERIKEKIYKYYFNYLFGVVKSYIDDKEIAKEVVNDGFLKAFNRIEKFVFKGERKDFGKTFRAWLVKIAVHTAIDRLRVKEVPLIFGDLNENLISLSIDIQDRLHVKDMSMLFDYLPDNQRTVFKMHEIEGYSHEEISKALKIPAGSSRVYLSKARQRIRILYTRKFL